VRTGSPQLTLREIRGNGAPRLDRAGPQATRSTVKTGDADYAIIDSHEFDFARHLYPEVMVAFWLPDSRPVQWVVWRDGLDCAMRSTAFSRTRAAPLLARITRATSRGLVPGGIASSRTSPGAAAVAAVLGGGAASGLMAAAAAVGYQVWWQPDAVSDNGAQGIMMLMADTAATVGVKPRRPEAEHRRRPTYPAQVIG
jgi:membrane-bound lytic murein transglycosylase F